VKLALGYGFEGEGGVGQGDGMSRSRRGRGRGRRRSSLRGARRCGREWGLVHLLRWTGDREGEGLTLSL
jgi:hypothetical protein